MRNPNMYRITFEIDPALLKRIDRIAKDHHRSRSAEMRVVLEQYADHSDDDKLLGSVKETS